MLGGGVAEPPSERGRGFPRPFCVSVAVLKLETGPLVPILERAVPQVSLDHPGQAGGVVPGVSSAGLC